MKDGDKTNKQLISELLQLRQRVVELETSENDLRRTEKLLREDEKHFRSLFESTTEGIITTDYEGRIVVTNLAAARILGYGEPENLVGLSTIELYADPAQRKKVFAELMEKGFASSYELVFKKKDGTLITCLGSATIIKDEDGKIKRVEGIFTDITERKKMEDQIKESRDFLENILKTSMDAIIVTDLQGTITMVNDTTENITGYSKDELLGESIAILVPQDETLRSEAKKAIEKFFKSGKELGKEAVWRGKNGQHIYVESNRSLIKDKCGQIVGAMGFIRDITERRKFAETLKMSEKKYRSLIESANDAVVSLSDDGILLEFNKKAEEMFGYSCDEVLGESILLLAAPEERERTIKQFERFKKTRQFNVAGKNIERKLLKKDGALFIAECSTFATRLHGNYIFTSFIRDATERREMEVALEKAHQELEKKVEERTANLKIANEQLQHEISVRTQAEEEIKKTKDYLDNIIEGSIDSIIVSDREGGITRFNKAFLKLTGYMEGEVIGKKFYDFILSEPGTYESTTGELVEIKENYFIDAKRMHEELYEEGKIENRKAYIVRKDGELVPVENNISLLYNEQDAFDGVTIIRNTVLRKKAEKKIFEYQNKLKSLTSQLTLTEERERRRFADYLHDQVGQKLFVSKLKLEALNKSLSSADNTKALGEIYEIIHQMIKDTRSLTSEISPPILYQFGLEAALEWLTEQTTEQYGIIIDFEDDEQEKELNDDMKIFLFQAVRELITNIAKHARAENAKVSIQRDNSHIRICVEDDGVGLTSSYRDVSKAAKEGFGLFSIGERMDHLGGQFEIKSQPDCGTQATLVAPLKGKKEI